LNFINDIVVIVNNLAILHLPLQLVQKRERLLDHFTLRGLILKRNKKKKFYFIKINYIKKIQYETQTTFKNLNQSVKVNQVNGPVVQIRALRLAKVILAIHSHLAPPLQALQIEQPLLQLEINLANLGQIRLHERIHNPQPVLESPT
jgi:hypothetical protein